MRDKITEGIDFYFEGGNMVFTETYHFKRGFCCGNCCRHCPYKHESVAEPRQNDLKKRQLKMKNEKKAK